jgi:hypothetical protein
MVQKILPLILALWIVEPAKSAETLSKSKVWLSLMHYQIDILPTNSTKPMESHFYLHPEGKNDPEKELAATKDAIENPKNFFELHGQPIQCAYPARMRVLKKLTGVEIPIPKCPALETWIKEMSPDEVDIGFASQFVGNPGSIMGHTFLNFIKQGREKYLNYTLGYAADIPDDSSLLNYAYSGIFGGFTGIFSHQPFYLKVQEYNVMERRDIWAYRLKLSPEERIFLLEILWEITSNAKTNYFFLKGNCSSVLLELLQPIFPEKPLLDFNLFYVTPVETLQILEKNNLLTNERYLPSLRTRLEHKIKNLSEIQIKEMKSSIRYRISPPSGDPRVQEALMDFNSNYRQENDGKASNEQIIFEEEVLLARSTFHEKVDWGPIDSSNPPLKTGSPRHLELLFNNFSSNGADIKLLLRPATHLLLDKDEGYNQNSSFSFLQTGVSKDASDYFLSEFTVIDILNRPSFNTLTREYSWGFSTGYYRSRFLQCDLCEILKTGFKVGISREPSRVWQFAIFATLKMDLPTHPKGPNEIRSGISIDQIFRISRRIKLKLDAGLDYEVSKFISPVSTFDSELRFHDLSENWDLGITGTYQRILGSDTELLHSALKVVYSF